MPYLGIGEFVVVLLLLQLPKRVANSESRWVFPVVVPSDFNPASFFAPCRKLRVAYCDTIDAALFRVRPTAPVADLTPSLAATCFSNLSIRSSLLSASHRS